jgi:DNA-binding beta-propeller fold protein YncE
VTTVMRSTVSVLIWLGCAVVLAQAPVREISYEGNPRLLKLPSDLYLGEVAGVSLNSKGHIFVFSRSGRELLLEFDGNGSFIREIGKGVYAFTGPSSFGAHSVRVDQDDNIWAVDSESNMVIKFDPEGQVELVLGRKPEPGQVRTPGSAQPPAQQGFFNGPTDIAFDSLGDSFISDGYRNSRIVKVDKNGKWVKTWGQKGSAPGEFSAPHSVATDSKGNVYVADRGNKRVQVFDNDGNFLNQWPADSQAICISPGPNEVLYTTDNGRPIYKFDLHGKLLGVFGRQGTQAGEIGWVHQMVCPSENTIFIGELLNWRLQKLTLHPEK